MAEHGFPWWLSGKESACQRRRHGSDPWSGKIPYAMKQLSRVPQLLSLCPRAQELQLLSPRSTTTEPMCVLEFVSAMREATSMRSPHTAPRE